MTPPRRKRPAQRFPILRPAGLWTALLASAWVHALTPAPAAGLPTLRVQGGVRLDAQAIHQSGKVTVSGRLRDELGHGLPGRTLHVVIGPSEGPQGGPNVARSRVPVSTNDEGAFATELKAAPGTVLSLDYAGSAFYPTVNRELVVRQPRAMVALRFEDLPASLDLDTTQALSFSVALASDAGIAGLPIAVAVNGEIAHTATTDHRGRARFALDDHKLPVGHAGFSATFAGDARRAPAEAHGRVVCKTQARLSLSTARPPGRHRLEVSAALVAGDAPLADQVVGLFTSTIDATRARDTTETPGADGRGAHVASARTDRAGVATFSVADAELPAGTTALLAQFVSHEPGIEGVSSAPAALPSPPRSPDPTWLAIPATLLLAVGAMAAWGARRRANLSAPATAAPQANTPAVFQGGPRRALARGSLSISGRIRDSQTGRDVPAAVTLHRKDGTAVAQAESAGDGGGGGGEFRLTAPAAGRFTLTVTAAGYRSERTEVDLPHRGRWHGTSVRLQALRSLAWEAARRLTVSLSPDADITPTLREALRRLAERPVAAQEPGLDRSATALANELEALLYGEAPPTEEAVAQAATQVEGLLAELQVSLKAQEVSRGAETAHIIVDDKARPSL